MNEPVKLGMEEREERVEKAIEESDLLRQKKRFQRGIQVLHEALRYRIKEDEIYYRLGNMYWDSGDLDRAETAYKRAIEINKNHVNAHHNLSVVYKRKGKITEFVKALKKKAKLPIETVF